MIHVYTSINGNKTFCFLFAIPIAFLTYFFSCKGFHWCSGIITIKTWCKNKKGRLIVFSISCFCSLSLILPWFIAYYPGAFSPDSIYQYSQAVSGVYDDWHPYWHTLIFFTLPLKITGQTASIVLLQIIYFAIGLGYLGLVIYKIAGLKFAIISLLYILLNPYTSHILLYPWKDVGFAIAGLVSLTMAIDYYFFREEWTGKWWRFIFWGLVMANATLFRHNAILFILPLILALLFHMQKRQWLQLFISFLMVVFLVKVPLLHILNVGEAQRRVVEIVGLPMTIIGNVVKETPEALDEEMSEFVYSIASQEQWEEKYQTGDFNSIKWQVDLTPINDAGIWKVLKIVAKCFIRSPCESLMAFFSLTDMVYGLEGDVEGDVGWSIVENIYGITYTGNKELSEGLDSYSILFTNSIWRYFKHIGSALLFMLGAILAKIEFNRWEDWKRFFLTVPILVYDFGTMLLLSGADSRFFYITFLVCPVIMIYAFYSKGAGEK